MAKSIHYVRFFPFDGLGMRVLLDPQRARSYVWIFPLFLLPATATACVYSFADYAFIFEHRRLLSALPAISILASFILFYSLATPRRGNADPTLPRHPALQVFVIVFWLQVAAVPILAAISSVRFNEQVLRIFG